MSKGHTAATCWAEKGSSTRGQKTGACPRPWAVPCDRYSCHHTSQRALLLASPTQLWHPRLLSCTPPSAGQIPGAPVECSSPVRCTVPREWPCLCWRELWEGGPCSPPTMEAGRSSLSAQGCPSSPEEPKQVQHLSPGRHTECPMGVSGQTQLGVTSLSLSATRVEQASPPLHTHMHARGRKASAPAAHGHHLLCPAAHTGGSSPGTPDPPWVTARQPPHPTCGP